MKWWDEKEAWRQTGFDYRPGDDLTATTPIIQPTKMDELPWLQQIVEKNMALFGDIEIISVIITEVQGHGTSGDGFIIGRGMGRGVVGAATGETVGGSKTAKITQRGD